MKCDCMIHRYHIAHICECGHLLSHSQGDMNEHRHHEMIDFAPEEYKHGQTASQVYNWLQVKGVLPYGTKAHEAVYDYAANNW